MSLCLVFGAVLCLISITPNILAVQAAPRGKGIATMPVGDLPGWKQIFTENFNTPVSLGNFPGRVYSAKWDVYKDGWLDTAGQLGKPYRYFPSKVVSVKKGMLR